LLVATTLFVVTATGLTVACVPLLPWHRKRVWLGGRYARWMGPVLLRVLGWTLEVSGREHITAERPALYAINHSSVIDTIAGMAIWPPHAVAIGKKSLLWVPGFGLAFLLMGNLFIDRADRARAIASMQRMTATMQRRGLSTLMAPEGTRSRDGRLGPFKKGFAHIAISAGIPVVPIVLHNAWELWPHPSLQLTSGVVRVTILPPIPTDDWTADRIDEHVHQVRSRFTEILED